MKIFLGFKTEQNKAFKAQEHGLRNCGSLYITINK